MTSFSCKTVLDTKYCFVNLPFGKLPVEENHASALEKNISSAFFIAFSYC